MSTRALIGIKDGDKIVSHVYNHHDGDLLEVGRILYSYYGTPDKVKELISGGDMSGLGETISKCDYYKDDDSSPNNNSFSIDTYIHDGEEFNYFFDLADNEWYVGSRYHGIPNEVFKLDDIFHHNKEARDAFLDMYVDEVKPEYEKFLMGLSKDPDAINLKSNERDKEAKDDIKPDEKSDKPKFRKFTQDEKIAWSKNKEQEITDILVNGIKDKMNSEEWKNFLDLSSNFANYSISNKMLVYLQCPEATIVKGAKAWANEYDRRVDDYDKAIYILAPQKGKPQVKYMTEQQITSDMKVVGEPNEDGRIPVEVTYTFYKPVRVYDVSATSGKELPPHEVTHTIKASFEECGLPYERDAVIAALKSAAPCSVEFVPERWDETLQRAYGYYHPVNDEIVIREDMSDVQTAKTLIHEIAHSKLHGEQMRVQGLDSSDKISDRSDMEIQAESVAYLVSRDLGIDTGDYSFGYISSYINGKDDVEKAFKELTTPIFACAKDIEADIDKWIDKNKDIEKDEVEVEL